MKSRCSHSHWGWLCLATREKLLVTLRPGPATEMEKKAFFFSINWMNILKPSGVIGLCAKTLIRIWPFFEILCLKYNITHCFNYLYEIQSALQLFMPYFPKQSYVPSALPWKYMKTKMLASTKMPADGWKTNTEPSGYSEAHVATASCEKENRFLYSVLLVTTLFGVRSLFPFPEVPEKTAIPCFRWHRRQPGC